MQEAKMKSLMTIPKTLFILATSAAAMMAMGSVSAEWAMQPWGMGYPAPGMTGMQRTPVMNGMYRAPMMGGMYRAPGMVGMHPAPMMGGMYARQGMNSGMGFRIIQETWTPPSE
jgi:hypothetical protein